MLLPSEGPSGFIAAVVCREPVRAPASTRPGDGSAEGKQPHRKHGVAHRSPLKQVTWTAQYAAGRVAYRVRRAAVIRGLPVSGRRAGGAVGDAVEERRARLCPFCRRVLKGVNRAGLGRRGEEGWPGLGIFGRMEHGAGAGDDLRRDEGVRAGAKMIGDLRLRGPDRAGQEREGGPGDAEHDQEPWGNRAALGRGGGNPLKSVHANDATPGRWEGQVARSENARGQPR